MCCSRPPYARHSTWRAGSSAIAYVDALVATTDVTPDALRARLESMAGLPWVEQAREMVDLCDPRAESSMESRMRLRYLDAGFPRPEPQWVVRGADGGFLARLDCALPARRYGFEYDGEAHHGPADEAHDEARRAAVREAGWRIDVFRREHVLGRSFAFERAVGESLSLEPRLLPYERRLRTYLRRRPQPPP